MFARSRTGARSKVGCRPRAAILTVSVLPLSANGLEQNLVDDAQVPARIECCIQSGPELERRLQDSVLARWQTAAILRPSVLPLAVDNPLWSAPQFEIAQTFDKTCHCTLWSCESGNVR